MPSDQTIKCVICRTPFLWTAAEQRAAALQPSAGGQTNAGEQGNGGEQASAGEQGNGVESPVAKPDRCPMCRRIAPAAGRQRGIVKWYSRTKGYGFITTAQGADIFLHKSVLREGQAPCAGQLVEFAKADGPRGVQADALELLGVEDEGAKPC